MHNGPHVAGLGQPVWPGVQLVRQATCTKAPEPRGAAQARHPVARPRQRCARRSRGNDGGAFHAAHHTTSENWLVRGVHQLHPARKCRGVCDTHCWRLERGSLRQGHRTLPQRGCLALGIVHFVPGRTTLGSDPRFDLQVVRPMALFPLGPALRGDLVLPLACSLFGPASRSGIVLFPIGLAVRGGIVLFLPGVPDLRSNPKKLVHRTRTTDEESDLVLDEPRDCSLPVRGKSAAGPDCRFPQLMTSARSSPI